MPDPQRNPLPAAADLQFQRAEPVIDEPTAQSSDHLCVACSQVLSSTYYHAQGQPVCPSCAERIQAGQQAPGVQSLVRAAIYGAGAALAGCALYAVVAIVTGFEIGLIAIVVGIMVGKAIRHASNGLGGRPQQILAVALTYFAITTSYIPVYVYKLAQQPRPAAQASQTSNQATPSSAAEPLEPAPRSVSLGTALFYILLLALAAPFLSLTSGVSALISLAIIFFGLSQAWRLTGRTDILVLGPYDVSTLERPEG